MYISEEDFKELDCKKLNGLLDAVHNKAVESVLKLMPEVITGLIVKTKNIQQIFGKFKKDHPELASKEQELGILVQAIELEDGSLMLDEILEKAAERYKQNFVPVPAEQPQTKDEIERTANGFI